MIDIRTEGDKVAPIPIKAKNEYNGIGQKLIITNDQKGLNKHATKNVDESQIDNSSLIPLKPILD